MASQLPPAGWYPDPAAPDGKRYWDGETWTRDTASAPLPSSSRSSVTETATATSSTHGKTMPVKSLPPSEWSRRQWAQVLLILGLPLLLMIGLVASLIDAQENPADTSATYESGAEVSPSSASPRFVEGTSSTEVATTSTLASKSTSAVEESDDTRLEAGTHAVGSDIAPGVYRVSIHWARLDENRDVIDNDLTLSGVSIMTVFASDSFIELSGTAMAIDVVPILNPIENGFNQGTYLVGNDLEPGTYRVRAEAGATAYAARLAEDLSVIDAEQNNDVVEVQLAATDYALRYTGTLERVE